MTLPRRDRRSITVDGVKYHYKIDMERTGRAVIQNADSTGAFLFVYPFTIMKPSHVADAIRFAGSCGWTPTRKGDACWLAFDADTEGWSCFEHIPNDDFRVVSYPSKDSVPDHMDA